jgi:hypothetical protein
VDITADLSYAVTLDGERWLQSSPVRAYFEHVEYPSPSRIGNVVVSNGTDEIGVFQASTQKWTAGSVGFTTAVKVYNELDIAVFETTVPGGASGTNSTMPVVPGGWPGTQGNVKPIVSFPAFSTSEDAVGNGTSPGLAALDQLRWEDNFCYFKHGPAFRGHGNKTQSMLGQGMYGGPVVLHNKKNLTADVTQKLTTLLFAPLDNVKHHGSYRNDTISSAWEMGVFSEITSLPPSFSHRTLMVAGAGVTATVQRYGALAMKLAGTDRSASLAKDLVVNKLGYWTDSGAYYYADIPWGHNLTRMAESAGAGMTMEDVSVKVKSTLDEQKVPIKYWQWDDWWYPGHPVYVWCVQDWSMLEYAFPSGLAGMYEKLAIPFLYYMPYWCMDNHTHAESYTFLTQEECGWECKYTFVKGAQSKAFHVGLFEKVCGSLSNPRMLMPPFPILACSCPPFQSSHAHAPLSNPRMLMLPFPILACSCPPFQSSHAHAPLSNPRMLMLPFPILACSPPPSHLPQLVQPFLPLTKFPSAAVQAIGHEQLRAGLHGHQLPQDQPLPHQS